ncbi:hypothetical protein [Halohasta salina]|uniref:hypothetical protein n=1 Tax=Halohasta salina TaxID=2961621 RepID=UPI0020A619C9|nr:hypothetical protein [Halohasta salina]
MSRPSTTRRGVLAAAGAVLLAGCGTPETIDDGSESIRATELRRLAPEDADPIVADELPVKIEQSHLRASAQRVDDLLAALPIPFGAESVPNGHIRQRLTDAAGEATERVAAARTAPSRLTALDELRWARSEARYAAAGWSFADGDLTESDLRTEHRGILDEAGSFRTEFAYLGVDPIEAALGYGRAERLLDSALDDRRTPARTESSRLLAVAEWGEYVESARAELSDAQHVYDRVRSTLPDGAGSVADRLSTATETLRTDLQRRRKDLPPEPDGDDRLRWRLWDEIHDGADSNIERADDPIGPASGLLAATEALTALRAADRLGDRLNGGLDRPETAAAVGDRRATAVDAITTALEESPRVDLARPLLAEAARSVRHADDRLTRFDGDVRVTRLDDVIAAYTAATLQARSVPAACQTTVDAVEES